MSLYPSPIGPLPPIPDDLTIPQFLLDSRHVARPYNSISNPWFIEEATGRSIGFEEVGARFLLGRLHRMMCLWSRCERGRMGWRTPSAPGGG